MTLQERLRRYYVESGANYVQEAADALDAKDERIRELEGALKTLVIASQSLDNAFTLGCRFRDNERHPEIAGGLVNLRTFIERAREALK